MTLSELKRAFGSCSRPAGRDGATDLPADITPPIPAKSTAYCEGGKSLTCTGPKCKAIDGFGCLTYDAGVLSDIELCAPVQPDLDFSARRRQPRLGFTSVPPPTVRSGCTANCGGGKEAVCGGPGCEAEDFVGCTGYILAPSGEAVPYKVPCNTVS